MRQSVDLYEVESARERHENDRFAEDSGGEFHSPILGEVWLS